MFKKMCTIPGLFFYAAVSFSLPVKTMNQHPITTIVTFNIANYNDHLFWPMRLSLIVNAIENSHADVIVLQEVRLDPDEPSSRASYENTAEQILRSLNEKGDFLGAMIVTQPAMYYPINTNDLTSTHNYPLPALFSPAKKSYLWEGLSIISKPRIIETGSYFLKKSSDCTDLNKRATQYVKIDNAGQELYIANVHFGLDSICAGSNIQETLAYLQQFNTHAPVLLVGDFNTTPDNPILAKLSRAGLVDIWEKLHPYEKGYTFPSDQPSKRIDYIWANAVLANQLTSPQQIFHIGDQAESGVYPSDHLGLAVQYGVKS